MDIDLQALGAEPRRFDATIEVDPDRLGHDLVDEPVRATIEGEVRRLASGVLVEGWIEAEGRILCSRCLAPGPWRCREQFAFELRPPESTPSEEEIDLGEEDMSVVFSDTDTLELKELAAQQVMLALPMKVLCDEGCRGLCPHCGANLNEGDCGCDRDDVDPRWEALRALKS